MSQSILFKDGLRIGKTELQWLQDLGVENMAALAAALSQQLPAVVPTTGGDLATELQVTAGASTVSIATGSAILKDGTYLTLSSAASLAVSTSVTNLPVVLRADTTPYGLGTLSLASDRVTLTYVPASGSTLTAAYYYGANDAVHLVDGSTDKGTYRVLTVSSNTIVLADTVPGTGTITGLKHAPAGKFFPGYPTGTTTDLISYDSAGVRLESAGYTIADNEIILATVTRGASGAPVVTDIRVPYRPRGLNNIVNSMIAGTASIAESKLALSAELTKAKRIAPFLDLTPDNQLYTTASDFFVVRDNVRRRVLTQDDVVTPAFSSLAVTPGSVSLNGTGTQTVTASVSAQPGVTMNYQFTSTNAGVVTVTHASPTTTSATLTGVSSGSALIAVRAYAASPNSSVSAEDTTIFIPVTVNAVDGVLTAVSLSPSTINVSRTAGPQTITASVTSPVASPNPTFTWSYVGNASSVVSLSATTGASVSLTPLAPGAAQIQLVASAPAQGAYSAQTMAPVILNVTVTQNLGLGNEPALRVSFVRNEDNLVARLAWGLDGTYTMSGLVASVTLTGTSVGQTFTANQYANAGFYDNAGTRYLIASHTASTASPVQFTLTKINTSDANPVASGNFVLRSLADQYDVDLLNATGTELVSNGAPFAGSIRAFTLPAIGAVAGTTYKFRLNAHNSTFTPSTYATDINQAWGVTEARIITVPANWISATPTAGGVLFRWNSLESGGFDRDTMDYYVQTKVGDLPWSNSWVRLADAETTNTEISYHVAAPPDTLCQLRVRIADPSNVTLMGGNIASAAYHGTAQGTSLTINMGGTDTEYVYPFTLNSGTVWENIGTVSNPRYIYRLTRADGASTSFTTAVAISRIDVEFSTALAQASGTAVVKGIAFPMSNPDFQVAGGLLTEGSSSTASMTSIDTLLPVNANGLVQVALEYVPTGDPNSLDPTGVGRVRVWYRGYQPPSSGGGGGGGGGGGQSEYYVQ